MLHVILLFSIYTWVWFFDVMCRIIDLVDPALGSFDPILTYHGGPSDYHTHGVEEKARKVITTHTTGSSWWAVTVRTFVFLSCVAKISHASS